MRPFLTALAAALLTGVTVAGPAAGQSGLTQLAGRDGCVAQPSVEGEVERTCARGTGLIGATGVAASADGRHVYVAAPTSDAVAILSRNPDTGALTHSGCVSDDGGDGRAGSDGVCADGDGLAGARAVAVTADGVSVYVAGSDGSLAAFARDPASGALRQIGCFRSNPLEGRCIPVVGINGAAAVVVSPDDRDVYVAAPGDSAVSWFRRDPATGGLSYGGCTSDNGTDGACTDGRGLRGAASLALSRDGRSLYVAAPGRRDEAVPSGGILTFRRTGGGAIAQTGCLLAVSPSTGCDHAERLQGSTAVAVSPEGGHLLGLSQAGLVVFARDGTTGAIGEQITCVGAREESRCETTQSLISGARSLAVSRSGREVAVAGGSSHLVLFGWEAATGALSLRGCVGFPEGCTRGRASFGASRVAFSADGAQLYLTARDSRSVGTYTYAMSASRAIAGRRGSVAVRVACPRGRTRACNGELALVRRSTRGRTGRASLGRSSRFRIRSGRAAWVRVRLSRASRRTLARRGRLHAVAAIRERASATPLVRSRIVLRAGRR